MWFTILWVSVVVVCCMTIILSIFGHVYRLRAGQTKTTANLKGKTIIITGASAGIGKEAALDLARREARIIMACRNLQKANGVAKWIEANTGNKEIVVHELDTSSLASVRAFADKILTQEKRLDVLILNAGIGGKSKRTLTSEGLEQIMATNHFGHFLLTNLLLGLLKASLLSRVVVVASMAHNMVKTFDPKDLNYEKGNYWQMHAYGRSKLCNILFARHLAHLVKEQGVAVNSMCPGFVNTEIFGKSEELISKKLYGFLARWIGKTSEQGAQTIIHLAASEETEKITSAFFENCYVSEEASNLAVDDGLAKKVWEESETIVDLKQHEQHY